MGQTRKNNIFITIVNGYKKIFFYFLKVFVITGLILGATFLIVYPIWYGALHYTQIYSYTVAGILILGGLFLMFKKIQKNILKDRQLDRPPFFFLKQPVLLTIKITLSIAYFYLFALFIYKHQYGVAAGTLVVYLCAAGYLFFSKKNS